MKQSLASTSGGYKKSKQETSEAKIIAYPNNSGLKVTVPNNSSINPDSLASNTYSACTPFQVRSASTSKRPPTPFSESLNTFSKPRSRIKFGKTSSPASSSSGSDQSPCGPALNQLDPRMQQERSKLMDKSQISLLSRPSAGHIAKSATGKSGAFNEGVFKMEEYVESQQAKLLKEQKKMEKIRQLIELKKRQNLLYGSLGVPPRENSLAMEKQKLAEERMLMMQEMEMERAKLEEDKRRVEDQKKILELQASVQKLEELVQSKQLHHNSNHKSIKDRLGSKSTSILNQSQVVSSSCSDSNRYFKFGKNDELESYSSKIKKNREGRDPLPEDLVLCELTDAGPVPKERRKIGNTLPEDLVLTEFGEHGPVSAKNNQKI